MDAMTGVVGVEEARARTEPGISYAIARLHQRLFASITERVAPYGLTTLQFTTLSVLSRHGAPLSTSQLARRAFMTPQSMSEVIHALEGKGLIKRSPHPNHRRTLPARITVKGRRVVAVCDEAVSDFENSMLEGFSEKDRAAFLGMVTAAVRNLGGGFPSEERPSSVGGT
jgi:DNA-binding MarR family transcriptional regulator